jgi:hypothetical protein
MRDLKTIMMTVASVVLTVLLGSAGCSQGRVAPSPYDQSRYENDQGEYRPDSANHEDRGRADDLERSGQENGW